MDMNDISLPSPIGFVVHPVYERLSALFPSGFVVHRPYERHSTSHPYQFCRSLTKIYITSFFKESKLVKKHKKTSYISATSFLKI